MANYLLACERLVREHGELLTGWSAQRLLLEDGAVVGAEIQNASGEQRVIRARSTLLATGGFGGDPELRAEHIHPLARDLPLRANTYSVGDGLRLGLSAGAAFGPPNAGFYGHLIPSKVAYTNPYEFTDLTFYHSEHGVLLNLEGTPLLRRDDRRSPQHARTCSSSPRRARCSSTTSASTTSG